jgi:DNA-binding MarR family transcriptional regulator
MQAPVTRDQSIAKISKANAQAHAVVGTLPMVMRFISNQLYQKSGGQLSLAQLRILSFIGDNPGTSLSLAAEDLGITRATASILVDRSVRRGYITRVEDPSERRKVLLNLTDSGIEHLQSCNKLAQSSVAAILERVPEPKLSQILIGVLALKEAFTKNS